MDFRETFKTAEAFRLKAVSLWGLWISVFICFGVKCSFTSVCSICLLWGHGTCCHGNSSKFQPAQGWPLSLEAMMASPSPGPIVRSVEGRASSRLTWEGSGWTRWRTGDWKLAGRLLRHCRVRDPSHPSVRVLRWGVGVTSWQMVLMNIKMRQRDGKKEDAWLAWMRTSLQSSQRSDPRTAAVTETEIKCIYIVFDPELFSFPKTNHLQVDSF